MGSGNLVFIGLANGDRGTAAWIIDSGASRHLTALHELLKDYISVKPTSIRIGNGKEIIAVGKGNVTLHTASGLTSLTRALYVPDINCNLISVASIVDQGFQVEFDRSRCIVTRGNTERVVGRGKGNIYVVTGLQEIALAGRSQQNDDTTREIWHKTHQENVGGWSTVVLNAPGPPRGVVVPVVYLIHSDPL